MPIIAVGKATHYTTNEDSFACGIESPDYSTKDPRKVDCLSCRRTNKFKWAWWEMKNMEKVLAFRASHPLDHTRNQ